MSTSNIFHTLRNSGTIRRHRRTLREQIQQEPVVQLLPTLPDLPLHLADMANIGLSGLLTHTPFVALHGPPGSGRSLALLQLAWYGSARGQSNPVLLLSLAQADMPALPPQVILDQALAAIGITSADKASRKACLLLLDDWETLPAARRDDWRAFLVSLPQTRPGTRAVVALPATDTDWPGFQRAILATPDDALIERWLIHLLPEQDHAPIQAALDAAAPLACLRERLLEIGLLCLTYPEHGLPANRIQLYEWAFARFNHPPTEGSPPPAAHASPIIGWSALRWYELARDMAGHQDMLRLTEMDERVRAEVALLLVHLLPHPEPLYSVLWGSEQPTPANLLILGRCLREQPGDAPVWWLRILTALHDWPESAPHQQLLYELGPRFPDILAAAGDTLPVEPTRHLLEALTPMLGGTALLALLDNPGLCADLRWVAADVLLKLPPTNREHLAEFDHPPDTPAQAARCYLLALGSPEERRRLATPDSAPWITALRDTPISLERRMRLAAAILEDGAVPAGIRSTVLAIAPHSDEQTRLTVMAEACSDGEAAVRQEALQTLQGHETRQILTVLSQILLGTTGKWAAQRDALEQLARYAHQDASALLARCALATHLPLTGRLRALQLLAVRRNAGPLLLRRLLHTEKTNPAVRAMAARHLGHLGHTPIVEELCRIATSNAPSLVRQGAVAALGHLGQAMDAAQVEIRSTFETILRDEFGDVALTLAVVQAMQAQGDLASVARLGHLLAADIAAQLRDDWLARVPHLDRVPVEEWLEQELPADIHLTLATALAAGTTEADRPGSLTELFELQALQIRNAIATALAHLGRQADEEARTTIRAMLMATLHYAPPNQDACHLLRCLADLSDDGGLSELQHLLDDSALDPMLRWLAIEQLGAHPAVVPLLVELLEQEQLDPFIASRVIQVLGQHGSPLAIPILCQLAEQNHGSLHLRTQAISALGKLVDPTTETTLFRLIANSTIPVALRAAAAEALAETFDPGRRVRLRALLNRERLQPELLASVIGALGRARDQESLPAMVRYILDDHPTVALRALTALAQIGDTSIAPLIMRVAQSAANQNVRLHAVGTLLQLEGTEYLPLLRSFLDSPQFSLQLQALDYLLSLQPDAPELRAMLTQETTPLAVRLRLVEALDHTRNRALLRNLLLDEHSNPILRVHTANVLGQHLTFDALDALTRCARQMTAPLWVRYRCITLLALPAQTSSDYTAEARTALSQISDDPTQPAENRAWATSALVRIDE
jgi:HEAT repeat protein